MKTMRLAWSGLGFFVNASVNDEENGWMCERHKKGLEGADVKVSLILKRFGAKEASIQ